MFSQGVFYGQIVGDSQKATAPLKKTGLLLTQALFHKNLFSIIFGCHLSSFL